tara:strand:+ start:613 stop:1257 length:645 start_codon:yes stop_codon:yes gene_type:complete
MRHGKKFNHLSRKSAHRKAMLSNMACSLIEHKRIKTTLAKAKALRVYIEPLITKSKNDTTHSRRIVFSYLKQKEAITELFSDISSKVIDRQGGYTRILKLSNRLGDNAQMAFIELVDYNDDYSTEKPKKVKSRRARKKNVDSSIEKDNRDHSDESNNKDQSIIEDVNSEDIIEEKKSENTIEDNDVSDSAADSVESKKIEKKVSNSENKEQKGE